MARIDVLPSIEIIRGFKGILDFYVWRGLPCVRAWPKYRPAKQTAASLAAALTFGAIVKAYALLANEALEAYHDSAIDNPRTARDYMVTGAYGNLHEASMSDFLDALIIIRDAIVAQTALLNALHSIDTDELVVRTEHSVLPDGAATAAAQATQLTALQKIDDLQDALESKALDRLLVRGMDQLFTFTDKLLSRRQTTISGADGYLDSNSPPPGQIWVVTNLSAIDLTSPTTIHGHVLQDDGISALFAQKIAAFAAGTPSWWTGHLFLVPGDVVRVYFTNALLLDTCRIDLTGYIMTLET